jgi:type IV fimbrial biogenesis protein FimT
MAKTFTSKNTRNNGQRGVTLIESLVALSITAVSAGVVVPGFDQMRERQHLQAVATTLKTDLFFARGMAVARGQTIRLNFSSQGSASCYVIHTGPSTDCVCGSNQAAVCEGSPEVLRTVHIAEATSVRLQSNSRSVAFDAELGTVTPTATIKVLAAHGSEIRQTVNVMGRVRSCSPSSISGYQAC